MKRLAALMTLIGALVLVGCGSSSSSVQTVDAQQFLQTAAQPDVTVVDVRSAPEYAAGHLKGAVNVDVEAPDFSSKIAALPSDKSYAVYCHSGRRSTLATDQMADAGFTSLYNLKGGIGDLQAAGGQIVAG